MIEFYIDNVGFKVDKVDDLKQLIEQHLLTAIMDALYAVTELDSEIDINFGDKNLGFNIGDDDEYDEEEEDEDDEL
jgi:hypothetical protein